ncbi:glycoside hydrolase family 9 protein [Marinoscillum furvescens]|uniref:Glycosyl hydrolase family 9 n=1 Tax=Marinoscillum furvescens DSM 4134 TaxID=1122208 RepID=A0A3D9KZ46_MARFU|nr:glycoside hydrolase family 9 protein [Marinoscillum furvescens]RED92015.1 glycosyl hydrolase family 9 [Marinoscillum furvescens DSM 4134]
MNLFLRSAMLFFSMGSLLLAEAQTAKGPWKITGDEYLHSKEVSVLAYHNHYPVGKLGGIEVIHHDQRIATNGMLYFRHRQQLDGAPVPKPIPDVAIPPRTVHPESSSIRLDFAFSNIDFQYAIHVLPQEDGAFGINVHFEGVEDLSLLDTVTFVMDFFPGSFKGKSYLSDRGDLGHLPYDFHSVITASNSTSLATGSQITLAPEDPERTIAISARSGQIQLLDSRSTEHNHWFTIAAEVVPNGTGPWVELVIQPNRWEEWVRPPVLAHSQVGYHPEQAKVLTIETLADQGVPEQKAQLWKIGIDGKEELVMEQVPKSWGAFMRYHYSEFDFTHITAPGLYQVRLGDYASDVFPIKESIYEQGVWQLSLNTFLPVQMCHMEVKDRTKFWHGQCHMDDAIQAPSGTQFFDGFRQASGPTVYSSHEHIPGLATGGWHDAADDDINAGSTGRTTYDLALMIEEFGMRYDQTTIDTVTNEVRLQRPDGVPDAVQQLVHGLKWILANYQVADHSFVGVISQHWETYLQAGGWGQMTDNQIFQPAAESAGNPQAINDDRLIFTSKDSRREYLMASLLAASARVLPQSHSHYAARAKQVAREIWQREQQAAPVIYDNVGTPRKLWVQKIIAATELYLTTKDSKYLDFLVASKEEVIQNFDEVVWALSRVEKAIKHAGFQKAYKAELNKSSKRMAARYSETPFGVIMPNQVWGYNWEILWDIYTKYYLSKAYPELFPADYLYNAIHYTLGRHPISNISHVSGVGTHEPIPAYGVNRADFAYIPGGVFSGVEIVNPDFFELKDNHPFLWQQSEYIVFGATPFIFSILAADQLLTTD